MRQEEQRQGPEVRCQEGFPGAVLQGPRCPRKLGAPPLPSLANPLGKPARQELCHFIDAKTEAQERANSYEGPGSG